MTICEYDLAASIALGSPKLAVFDRALPEVL
jgi:hypothetical protein